MPKTSPAARRTVGRRRALALALALAGSVTLTACGSSSSPRPGHKQGASLAVQFSACMRSHGVPNFPDQGSGGGPVQIGGSSGVNPFSPSFQAAQAKCRHLLPGGGPSRGRSSAQVREMLVKDAQCMRAHGITSFPDPTNAPPPTTPPANGGAVLGGPGGVITLPKSMIESPGFKAAAAVCGFPGFGKGGGKQLLPGG